ncbi:MAG: zf-HC2 domain-containing protein [Betaproteobacteria bacterium]|nr:zf-HC2 domain-containing protein [Betaproteobacteria bacterium]
MITCPESTRLLSVGMDGEMSFFRRLLLRAHLKRCPACRRCEEQFRFLRATMLRWKI